MARTALFCYVKNCIMLCLMLLYKTVLYIYTEGLSGTIFKLIHTISFLTEYIFFLSIGKSLYVDRLFERFQQISSRAKHIRIRLIEPCIDIDSLVRSLSETLAPLREQDPVLLHIDTAGVSMQAFFSADILFCCWLYLRVRLLLHFFFTCQVRSGLEELLFHLLVLGCLSDSHGMLWRRNGAHLITVEVMRLHTSPQNQTNQVAMSFSDHLLFSIWMLTVTKCSFKMSCCCMYLQTLNKSGNL